MAEFITKGCVVSGDYIKIHGDEEIFGHKDFINDVTVRGDLNVSGRMNVTEIVDRNVEGDISGHVFRGDTGYFDTIIVGDIQGSNEGGSSGESSGGLNTGPIFVTSVSAVGGVREIVESDFGGAVIKKVKTASDQVDINLMVERGDAQTYKPQVFYSISGQDGTSVEIGQNNLNQHSNGYSFDTTLRLDSSNPITYLFSNGSRTTFLSLEKDTPPEVVSAEFINLQGSSSFYETSSFTAHDGTASYQQTEAKNGDTARVRVVVRKEPSIVNVSGGAVSSKNVSSGFVDNGDGTFTVEFNVTISGANNSTQDKSFNVFTRDLIGNQSTSISASNTITLNNSSPSGSISFSYPNADNIINNTTDEISFNVNANNFDKYNFSKSGVMNFVQTPANLTSGPFILNAQNANNRTSGTMSVTLFRQANGRTSNFSSSHAQIQSFGTVPSLSFSPNVFSSSAAGASVSTIYVSIGEEISSLAVDSVSDPNISVSNLQRQGSKNYTLQISVSDSTPRGAFTINFLATKIIGETFTGEDIASVRGFSQRTVTAVAPAYEPVALGVDVLNTSKLTVSVQPDGGNSFSVGFDSTLSGAKQDGSSNLEAAFGIIDNNKIVIDNQVITNAGNILDVFITVEESM